MSINSQFKEILTLVHNDSDLHGDFSTLTDLAICLTIIFKYDFTNNLLPAQFYSSLTTTNNTTTTNNSTTGKLLDVDLISGGLLNANYPPLIGQSILQKPIFTLFKELSQTTNQSSEREILIHLLSELYAKQTRIGYYFLYYMYSIMLKLQLSPSANTNLNANNKVSISANELTSLIRIYREFIQERNNLLNANNKPTAPRAESQNQDYEKISSSSASSNDSSSSSSDTTNSDDSGSESDSETQPEFSESDLTFGSSIMHDLRLCQQDDPYLFCYLLPFVCSGYLLPGYMINNSELVYLIVSCVDARQVKDLISSVISQDLILFKELTVSSKSKKAATGKSSASVGKPLSAQQQTNNSKKRKRNVVDSAVPKWSKKLTTTRTSKQNKKGSQGRYKKETLMDVIGVSLFWESVEQIFFWELLLAHDEVSMAYLLPVFNRLEANKHSEATCYLFQMIKASEPTFELVRYVVNRRVEDNVARALLINWSKKCQSSQANKMSQIFIRLLNKSAAAQSANSANGVNNNNNGGSGSGGDNQLQSPSQTTKKIKYNETLSSTNKVKLTAQQQLEQNQRKTNGNATNGNGGVLNLDEAEFNKIPSLDQVTMLF